MISMKMRDITIAMGMEAKMMGQVFAKELIFDWMVSAPRASLIFY